MALMRSSDRLGRAVASDGVRATCQLGRQTDRPQAIEVEVDHVRSEVRCPGRRLADRRPTGAAKDRAGSEGERVSRARRAARWTSEASETTGRRVSVVGSRGVTCESGGRGRGGGSDRRGSCLGHVLPPSSLDSHERRFARTAGAGCTPGRESATPLPLPVNTRHLHRARRPAHAAIGSFATRIIAAHSARTTSREGDPQ